MGGGANTGPKGVIADCRRFKQLEAEKRAEQVQCRSFRAQSVDPVLFQINLMHLDLD